LGALILRAIWILLLTASTIFASVGEVGQAQREIILIIDNDPGSEDYLGLMMALKWPNVKIEALTVAPGVIPDADIAATNLLKFLEYLGRQDIPVAVGMRMPMKGEVIFPKDWTDRWVHFWDDYPRPVSSIEEMNAVDLIISRIMSLPGKLVLVATGPLTNIASAIQKEPRIVQNVQRIVIMGGTTLPEVDDLSYVPGTSRVAEFNIFTDPEAASIVFGSGAQITMVGLNVAIKARLTSELFESMKLLDNRASRLIDRMFSSYFVPGGPVVFETPLWDTLTIAASVDPSFVTTQTSRVKVVLEPRSTRGRTLVTKDPSGNVNVSLDVDSERLSSLILELLSKFAIATTTTTTTTITVERQFTTTAVSTIETRIPDATAQAYVAAVSAIAGFAIGLLIGRRKKTAA